MNVLTNLNLVQNVFMCVPYDDLSIVMLMKKKLEYKYIYMIGYVHFNIVMKTLQQLCQTPLYISAKVSIKPNCEDFIEFVNASKNIDFEKKNIENDINEEKIDKFEKILEEDNKYIYS